MKRSQLLIIAVVLIAALVGCTAEPTIAPTATEIAATSTGTVVPTLPPICPSKAARRVQDCLLHRLVLDGVEHFERFEVAAHHAVVHAIL